MLRLETSREAERPVINRPLSLFRSHLDGATLVTPHDKRMDIA